MATPWVLVALAAPAAAEEAAEDVENILVTAERREEDADRVPIALSVATGDALDASGVESSLDLPFRTPGLVFSTSSVLGQPYLRGVGTDVLSAGADASVATLVDGVYQSRAVSALQDFYDVERVEVLKGPQGTLFGRNAAAGVIHVVNRRPQPELGAQTDLVYGSFDKLRVRGALNAPVVKDRMIARISGLRSQRRGFTDNLFLDRDLDDEDYWAYRGQLLVRAFDDVSLLLRADGARERSTRGLAPKVGEPLAGNSGVAAGARIPPDPRDVRNDTANAASVDAWGTSSELDWDLPIAHMKSLTAFRRTRFSEVLDFEATEVPAFVVEPDEDSDTVSQELQWSSVSDGPLEWIAGLFYLHEDAAQRVATNVLFAGVRDVTDADLRADALAAFGQGTLTVWDVWRLTAGLRYSYEDRREDFAELVNGSRVAAFDVRENWDALSPRFVLEYAPNEELLAYASASRGFKSGGFNSTFAQERAFDPEYLWAYEVGVKSSWPRARTRLRGAVFYYDYDDIQLQLFRSGITFPEVVNAGTAEVFGVEVEAQLAPFPVLLEGLELEASVAWLDASFSDLDAIDPNDPGADPDRSDNRLPRAPELAVFAAAQYRLGSRYGTVIPRIEYRHQSAIFFSIFEDRFARQGAYGLWNVRLRYEAPNGAWFVTGFVENLSDELYAQNVVRSDGVYGRLSFWGPPRTYGLQVGLVY